MKIASSPPIRDGAIPPCTTRRPAMDTTEKSPQNCRNYCVITSKGISPSILGLNVRLRQPSASGISGAFRVHRQPALGSSAMPAKPVFNSTELMATSVDATTDPSRTWLACAVMSAPRACDLQLSGRRMDHHLLVDGTENMLSLSPPTPHPHP